MHFRQLRLLPIVLFSLLLAACVAPVGLPTEPVTTTVDGPKQLTIAETFWPDAGYAIETDDSFALTSWGAVEPLIWINFVGEVEPWLAESWTQVDANQWSFTLRDGVTFHNGEALTADAVVTAFTYLLGAETPPRGFSPENISTIEAVDARTVVITTVEPDVLLPKRLTSPSFSILAPAAYDTTPPNVFGTGTGPFVLVEDVPMQSATLRKNETYWGGPVNIDEVTMLAAVDAESRATMLRTGEVDIAQQLPIPQLPMLEADGDINIIRLPQPRTTTLYLNNSQGPMSDVRVRRAVLHAIDKQAIVDAVLEGVGAPAAGPFAPNEVWVNADLTADTFDPELSKALLTEAGYAEGELQVNLWTYPTRANLPPTAVAVQQMLTNVGIAAEVRIAPYNVLEPSVLAEEFDIFIVSRNHLLDNHDPEGFLQADYGCEGSYNLNAYCNPEVDALLAEARGLADPAARYDLYRQIQQTIVVDDVVSIWTDYTVQIYGHRAGVVNYQPHLLGQYLLTPELDLTR
ncbi:ABC transporter substrate-binding protein [bacterium]|nr:ABC transporter substrate-binding protein [bacterium]